METWVHLIIVWLPFSSSETIMSHGRLLDTFSRCVLIAFLDARLFICLFCSWRNVLALIFRKRQISTVGTPYPQVPLINYVFGCFGCLFGSRKPLCDAFSFSWVLFSFLNSGFPFSPSKKLYFTEWSVFSSISALSPILLDCLEPRRQDLLMLSLDWPYSQDSKSPEPAAFWLSSAHSATGLHSLRCTRYVPSAFSSSI